MINLWAECIDWKSGIFFGLTTFYFIFTWYLVMVQIPISKRNIKMDKEEIRRFVEKKRKEKNH